MMSCGLGQCPKVKKVRLGIYALELDIEDTLERKRYHIELDQQQLLNLHKVLTNYLEEELS